MFIKEIFEGRKAEDLHNEFLKFGRGEYKDKYLIEAKKQKDIFSIKTTAEFANTLVKICLEEVSDSIKIRGIIVSTFDLTKEAKFKIVGMKQFMGIKQFAIDSEINKRDLLDFMNKFPRLFYALSFNTGKSELKIKAKAPKSAKPSTAKDKEIKIDFCSLKTSNINILKELFFDIKDFKQMRISHTIKINDIIYPKNEKDPVKVRENSVRKGQIIRNIEFDEKKEEKIANFEG